MIPDEIEIVHRIEVDQNTLLAIYACYVTFFLAWLGLLILA